ncbi:MAG: BMP family ABC transporter substrate-binding protein, partial [Desulfobacterales bacterium]
YEAGKERKTYVIGVDSNQNHLGHIKESGENFGLTSMLKQVDVAVYLTIKDLLAGKFQAGVRVFGLGDTVQIDGQTYHGVYYALDEYNKDLVTQKMIEKVTEAEKKILSGEIKVPEK